MPGHGRGWRGQLSANGIRLKTQQPLDVLTGVIVSPGGAQVAMGIGGETVILPLADASRLVVNLKKAIQLKTQLDT
jgi:hypothetical protein